MEFGTWNLEFGIWNLEFGIWNLEFGIWNLEFGIWCFSILTIIPKPPQLPCIASPVFVYFYIQFEMHLLAKKFL
ncbi:MAG: hypothetical protein COS19_07950 [Flavobacteriaceae bacterium CG02_land_8_20_14_3_00_34_13]|nr:MAG: hypothetical protein COS19_07950 [Flavobacteriaceae bacterium CG02_land_8_20_14_3_00_34_13]